MRYDDRVTVLRAGPPTEDEFGNAVPGWAAARRTQLPAVVNPMAWSATEDTRQRDTTMTRWRVFLPPNSDVTYLDRVEWDGITLEVDGEVERWRRRGREHHVELIVKRVQGA